MKVIRIFTAAALVCFAASCQEKIELPTDLSGGCPAVDLGIKTADGKTLLWAEWNIGATTPLEAGSFFAWGETETKYNYDYTEEGQYDWGVYVNDAFKFYGMTKYQGHGEIGGDGLITLQPGDDAATKIWGTKWRMPTFGEILDLLNNCNWDWDENRKGYNVWIAEPFHHIFLPAGGSKWKGFPVYAGGYEGCYWSSGCDDVYVNKANAIVFTKNDSEYEKKWLNIERCYGALIRPVTEVAE